MLIAFVPGVLATLAFGLSVMSNFWCETIKFDPVMGGERPARTFGPFYVKELVATNIPGSGGNSYRIGEKCVNLPDGLSKDANWKTTQAFAIITAIVGGVMLFFTWLSPCFDVLNRFWKQAGCLFIFCSITQGLTLIFLESNACLGNSYVSSTFAYKDECSWDWGTRTNISSVVFWFLAGVSMMFLILPARTPERPPAETQTVTYTKNADGTVGETGVVKGTYVAGEGVVNNPDPEEGAPTEP
jgi:hypothetical protein